MSVADTDIPVTLGYNGCHYEAVVPKREEDIRKTVFLKNEILNGNFNVTMNEITESFKNATASRVGHAGDSPPRVRISR